MATAIMKEIEDLNNIFADMSINDIKKESSVKTAGKKKDSIMEIKEMTDTILKSAGYIESNWDKLSAEQKENLNSFSYSYIGEGKMQKTSLKDAFKALKTAYSGLKSLSSGKLSLSDISDFFVALDKLNNAILTKIEYDNPAYKEKLNGLIESAIKGEGKDMSYDEFKGWLNGMANKAGK
ncbi:MAG: hypothetical protein M1576_01300 [Deltaproteobacteria bacterium]|jgi:hypothetical protein|nr:hypothetical protein [Deltaproteobacteria bacterium]